MKPEDMVSKKVSERLYLVDNRRSEMTEKQRKEHARLLKLWATRKATKQQIARCMMLDRLLEAESMQRAVCEKAR